MPKFQIGFRDAFDDQPHSAIIESLGEGGATLHFLQRTEVRNASTSGFRITQVEDDCELTVFDDLGRPMVDPAGA